MLKNFILLFILCMTVSQAAAETLIIAAEDYPPYEYLKKGNPAGMDVEIVNAAAALTNVDITYKFFPWKRALRMAKTGFADAIICLSKTKERTNFLYFCHTPLSIERLLIFTNEKGTTELSQLSELTGKRVGIIAGYTYSNAFDNFHDIIKDKASTQELLIKKLSGNRFRYAVHNEVAMYDAALKADITNIRPTKLIINESPLYIGFSKKSRNGKEMYQKFCKALHDLEQSGELERIRKKYSQ